MIPRYFLDVKLLSTDDGGLAIPVLANNAFRILHGAFRDHPGQFALALPACKPGRGSTVGNILRVFASTSEHLMMLVNSLEGHHFIRDYCLLSKPLMVPEDFSGGWIQYRRYRTSNRNAERKTEGNSLRERRMANASEKRLPYFRVTSKSNQHGFSLFVEALADKAPAGTWEAMPDGYGLAVSTRPFTLPDVPFF